MSELQNTSPPKNHAANRRTHGYYIALVVTIFFLGVFLRLNRYLFDRSLWHDEANFALNIIERTPVQLVGPLAYGQHSPVGFTLAVKYLTMAFGVREPILRLIPLVVSIVSLVLFYFVARRWLPPWATLLAMTIFATSDALGEWAAQFEKYSSDVTLTLIILAVGLWVFESERPVRFWVFGLLGVVAVWFSYPAAIVLAGIGLVLFFYAIERRDKREALLIAAIACIWLASFAITYVVATRASVEGHLLNPSSAPYWNSKGGFLIFPPINLGQVDSDIMTLVEPFENPMGFALYSGVVLLYWLGLIEALRKRSFSLFLLSPILITVALSALGLYPIFQRVVLFTVPLLLLTVMMGIVRLSQILSTRMERLMAIIFIGFIIFQPVRLGLAGGLRPDEREETLPLIAQLAADHLPGDEVMVYYGAEGAYRYYAYVKGLDQVTPSIIEDHRSSPEEYCQEMDSLNGKPRVWVIFSHVFGGKMGSEEEVILSCLDQLGVQIHKASETGASLYLYDLSTESRGSPPDD